MRYFLLIFIGLLSFSGTVYADCATPTGVEGDQIYNSTHKVMQFCDGTNWNAMKGGVADSLDGLSCSDGEVAKWNNGGNIWECASDNGGIASESDPQVDAVTSGKWCRGDGSAVVCDQTAPSGGGANCGGHVHAETWQNAACSGWDYSMNYPGLYQCINGTTKTIIAISCSKGSCFTANTFVVMADGTSKEIYKVTVGDQLLGANGEINTVLDLDRTLLWKGKEQHLIRINNEKEFMTDNHPVMTTKGWKSFAPKMAEREAFDQLAGKVQQLEIGDEIILADGALLKVKSIDIVPQAKDDTRLYNFYLDGNHTYHANGMLVYGFVPDKAGHFTISKYHNGEPSEK